MDYDPDNSTNNSVSSNTNSQKSIQETHIEKIINNLESQMYSTYGTRIRKGLRPRSKRNEITSKFQQTTNEIQFLKCDIMGLK